MDESEPISSFFDRVQYIVKQMQVNGEKIDDQRIVEIILRNMVSKFDHVVTAVEQAHDLLKMTIEMLLGILTSHEYRLNQRAKNSHTEHALQREANITNRGGYQGGCNRGRGRG